MSHTICRMLVHKSSVQTMLVICSSIITFCYHYDMSHTLSAKLMLGHQSRTICCAKLHLIKKCVVIVQRFALWSVPSNHCPPQLSTLCRARHIAPPLGLMSSIATKGTHHLSLGCKWCLNNLIFFSGWTSSKYTNIFLEKKTEMTWNKNLRIAHISTRKCSRRWRYTSKCIEAVPAENRT
jgi:hypothetical protein